MESRFPIPPGVVGKVIRAAADPATSAADLGRLLEKDAVLTAQVLRTVNSATFGLRHKVAAMDRAVTLMGVRAVRNLVLSLAVRDLVPLREVSGFPLELFWESSLRRGAAARCLAERLELSGVDEYFTMGLCQDVGLLARLQEDRGLAVRLEPAAREISDLRLQFEREAGEGHDAIGFALFAGWSFPEELSLPIRHHHGPEEAPEPHRLAARVAHAAEALADLGFVTDKPTALEAVNERLAALGIGSDEAASIVDRINELVSEFAELLGLRVETRLSYHEIIAIASTGLADLNLSYEEMNRKLHESLSQQQRMAAELARLNQELDRQARTDSLSGLPNRRAFDEALLRELAVAQRQNAPLSVVILDIDHFKRINDERGHLAGDHVLSEIGRLLRERVRLSDLAARYGGEEFALILPFTGEEGALIAAERFRKAIEDRAIGWGGAPVRVTASFGGSTLGELRLVQDELVAVLLGSADAALYEAKRRGRNRVCWKNPALEPATV